MNTILIALSLAVIITLYYLWLKDSRVFLYFWYKLVFDRKTGPPFLHNEKKEVFPESKILENNCEIIQKELRDFLSKKYNIPRFHELDPAQKKISFDSGPAWRTHLLKAYGVYLDKNCACFPATKRILDHAHISTALFSILEPGTCIPVHEGQLDGIYRYHLGLEIPNTGNCFIRVANEEYHWQKGVGILFNDTYLHEVKNLSDEYRIVLFLDIKRPFPKYLEFMDKLMHKLTILSPRFKKARREGHIIIDL